MAEIETHTPPIAETETRDNSKPSSHLQPEQELPEPKRQKLSTDAQNEETTLTVPKTPKPRQRKIAIFFAYCGVGYQGMQKNPGAKTIEGDLEEALFFSGAISEEDRGRPKRFEWARSARTDKGVSAVGQVVSGKFYVDPSGFVERLNSKLPQQIRIFGYKRVTPSFNSKKFCDRRRYVYLIPVFALDPSSHRDGESVFGRLGSGDKVVECLECSEREKKVAESKKEIETVKTCNVVASMEEKTTVSINGNDIGDVKSENKSNFFYGEEEKERFNRILKYYEGTHNFHNFTTRTKAEDPSAKRFIVSFNANTVVNIDGIEFVKCEVIGQSFMLHQIRKMIGLAVSIMRNYAPESVIETAYKQKVNINIPMAPEVGLYLDECFFPSYNNKWKSTHEELSMKDFAEAAEEFKMKYIYSHIAATEHKEGVMGLFLHSLDYRNYADLRAYSDSNSVGVVDTELKCDVVVEDNNSKGDVVVEDNDSKCDVIVEDNDSKCDVVVEDGPSSEMKVVDLKSDVVVEDNDSKGDVVVEDGPSSQMKVVDLKSDVVVEDNGSKGDVVVEDGPSSQMKVVDLKSNVVVEDGPSFVMKLDDSNGDDVLVNCPRSETKLDDNVTTAD